VGAGVLSLSIPANLPLAAQQISEPFRSAGANVTPAYEGWFTNADGTHTFLIGYLNRNTSQVIEVPVGPNNRMEPGGPDLGQPTVFLPGRQVGVFTITVPKEFDRKQRLSWSITSNGLTTSVPFWMNEPYEVNPWTDVAVGNRPPVLRFDPKGPAMQGPVGMVAKAFTNGLLSISSTKNWASGASRPSSVTRGTLNPRASPARALAVCSAK